jgi:hypothetical protein
MKSYRVALAVLFGLASLGMAEDKPQRRLESVTWNPVKKELTWVVSSGVTTDAGNQGGKKYQPGETRTYRIDMENATMTFNGETRKFSQQEATSVSGLMALISTYAVESTIWWEKGHGEKVSGGERVSAEPPASSGQCSLPTLAALNR